MPLIRLHDMRHGVARCCSGGVPIEMVEMIRDHSSAAVTRKVYAHLSWLPPHPLETAVSTLNEQRHEQSVSKVTDLLVQRRE